MRTTTTKIVCDRCGAILHERSPGFVKGTFTPLPFEKPYLLQTKSQQCHGMICDGDDRQLYGDLNLDLCQLCYDVVKSAINGAMSSPSGKVVWEKKDD